MTDLNQFIKPSHIRMVERFNEDLEAFRIETGDEVAELYEDPFTSFTLSDVKVQDGALVFVYDGVKEKHDLLEVDYETSKLYEDDLDGIVEWIGFFRKCLRRAKRYWSMDVEKLDAIQDGEIEDTEEE